MNAVLAPRFTMQVEHYSPELIADLMPLLKANWESSESYKPDIVLKPNWEKYRKMDEMGMMLCLTARQEGRLVGYAIWFIVSSFNYESMHVAHGSAWYMEPSVRGHGLSLLRYGERLLRERGIKRFYWFTPPGSALNRLASALGYKPDEIIMEKIL